MTLSSPHHGARLIRLPEVLSICGLARSTVYLYIQRGQFPAPVKITKQASAWSFDEVQAWVADRLQARV